MIEKNNKSGLLHYYCLIFEDALVLHSFLRLYNIVNSSLIALPGSKRP